MSLASKSRDLAKAWLAAFNGHDIDALVALYAAGAVHFSPKLKALHPETEGRVVGREAIGAWWREALARAPKLRYEERSITANEVRVVIEYVRHVEGQPPLAVAEVFDLAGGEIVASRVYHA
jgi:hypothetical protein